MLTKAYIPYRGYYSTPFVRWQGSLANEHSIVLGANTSRRFFESKGWDPKMVEYVLVGSTVYQKQWFYSGPWAAGMMGAAGVPGVLVSQACSTSTFAVYQAGMGIETGLFGNGWCLLADRCSNGPHATWPNPNGPGGQVISEDWVMDNFGKDPWAGGAMIQTAENVSREHGVTREECDAITLRRQEQYRNGLANDREFQKRYMFPVEVQLSRKKTITVAADEGVFPSTKEGLAGLKPVLPEVVHHPVLGDHLAAGAVRVRPRGVRAVGAAVGEEAPAVAEKPGLDPHAGLVDGERGGGARLADEDAGNRGGAHHPRGPGAAVEPLLLVDGAADQDVLDHLRVPPLRLEKPPGGVRPEDDRMLVGQRSLPADERGAVIPSKGDVRLGQHGRISFLLHKFDDTVRRAKK
ncbi:MAG TPA: hypothetical protein VFB91_00405, partial [Terriglobales bacterium]|nr:hypothetical protein [Terriglobales bacterium]